MLLANGAGRTGTLLRVGRFRWSRIWREAPLLDG